MFRLPRRKKRDLFVLDRLVGVQNCGGCGSWEGTCSYTDNQTDQNNADFRGNIRLFFFSPLPHNDSSAFSQGDWRAYQLSPQQSADATINKKRKPNNVLSSIIHIIQLPWKSKRSTSANWQEPAPVKQSQWPVCCNDTSNYGDEPITLGGGLRVFRGCLRFLGQNSNKL